MSKRKSRQKGKPVQPALKGSVTPGTPDRTPSDVPASPAGPPPIHTEARTGLAGWSSKWFPTIKTVREFIVAGTAVAAILISAKSCITAKESLMLSTQQAEANRRYHQEHVKPDVRKVVRHSTLTEYKDSPMPAELVVWNNGPIKAVH